MIDNFALAVSHGLLIFAVWKLLSRPDLDDDGADPNAPKRGFGFRRAGSDSADA